MPRLHTHLTVLAAAHLVGRSNAMVWKLAKSGALGPLHHVDGMRGDRIAITALEATYGTTFSAGAIDAAITAARLRPKRKQPRLYTRRQVAVVLQQRDAAWRTWLADKRMQRAHPNGPREQEGTPSV